MRILYATIVCLALGIGTIAGVAVAQTNNGAQFQPFVIDVAQDVPFEVTLDQGDTVSMTVSVELRVKVTGPEQATVQIVGEPEPEIAVSEIEPVEYDEEWTVVGETQWRLVLASDAGNMMEPKTERWAVDRNIETSGKFIVVTMEVENIGKEVVRYENPVLIDGMGRNFEAHSEGGYYALDEENCAYERINPNLPRTCAVIYEVAADAEGLAVLLHDLHDSKVEHDPLSLGF